MSLILVACLPTKVAEDAREPPRRRARGLRVSFHVGRLSCYILDSSGSEVFACS